MSRRISYGVGAVVNIAIAWAINLWPGWEAVPFLTDETSQLLPLINLSLILGVVANVAYLFFDPPWFKALGNVVTVGISLAVLVQAVRIFPFDFGEYASTWDLITEGFLIFLIITTGLALIVQFVQLVRLLVQGLVAPED